MVIDASALLAILLGEPERGVFARAIATAEKRIVSAFSVLESAVVIHARKGPAGARELDLLLHKIAADVVPLTPEHVELAREAYSNFGKGHHPARLNLGDCCAYAAAHVLGRPLLCKGDDFPRTDLALLSW